MPAGPRAHGLLRATLRSMRTCFNCLRRCSFSPSSSATRTAAAPSPSMPTLPGVNMLFAPICATPPKGAALQPPALGVRPPCSSARSRWTSRRSLSMWASYLWGGHNAEGHVGIQAAISRPRSMFPGPCSVRGDSWLS
eukprot:scaffold70118_cov32-Tisochrysis_lutea.AAC.2